MLGTADRAVGAGQKTSDLVLCALVRARFGELVTPLTRHGQSDLLLLGPLSMLDVMLEMPMSDIVKKILLDSEAKAVFAVARFIAPDLPVDAGAGKGRMGDCAQHLRYPPD